MQGVIYWAEEWKSWGVYLEDEQGNQVSEAEWYPTKREAVASKKDYPEVKKWTVGVRIGGESK